MKFKIVALSFFFLFSIVHAVENVADLVIEDSTLEKLHKTNSFFSIAVSNVLVFDPIATAPIIANYAFFCGVLNLSEHLFLRCQKKETNAFHKLVQATLYLAVSNYITDAFCSSYHPSNLSIFCGSTFLILAGLNGYCKIDEAIIDLAKRKADQVKL